MLTQSAVKWRYIYGILLHMENGQLVLEKTPNSLIQGSGWILRL